MLRKALPTTLHYARFYFPLSPSCQQSWPQTSGSLRHENREGTQSCTTRAVCWKSRSVRRCWAGAQWWEGFSVKVFHRTSNSRSESCSRELLKQWGFRGPKATDTRPGTKGIEIPKFPALWVNRLQAPVHSGTEQHPFPAALGEVRAWIPCAGASCSEQSRVRTVISP